MKSGIYKALASCVIVGCALVFVEPAARSATHDRHQRQIQRQAKARAHHWAKTRKKLARLAVSYVCPMHPDIRENSRGACPKCLMSLVAEPRNAKTGSGAQGKMDGIKASDSTPGGSNQDRKK